MLCLKNLILHDPLVCTIVTVCVRRSVPPSVHGQLVKMLIMKMLATLERHVIFSSNFAYLCISALSNHRHCNSLFDGRLLSIILAGCGQLVKLLVSLGYLDKTLITCSF